MAHPAQHEFCRKVKDLFAEHFIGKSVLDVGSYDINGNNRYLFKDCSYTGIDIASGPNVDRVTAAHEFDAPHQSFDTIISTECFEHDMHFPQTLQKIVQLLKPGGLFLFSCASKGRKEHGTIRRCPGDSPATVKAGGQWAEYYRNLEESDIRAAVHPESVFSEFEFQYNQKMYDLYFWGIRNSEQVTTTPIESP